MVWYLSKYVFKNNSKIKFKTAYCKVERMWSIVYYKSIEMRYSSDERSDDICLTILVG